MSGGRRIGVLINVIKNLILFVLFCVGYYMSVNLVVLLITVFSNKINSGSWVIGMILGMIAAPILSILTVIKLNKR
ncbi:hypothetical protein [Cellulosilyticum lentocellum]|uniref:Uncharacterized protein n=1 Tax=Cellulosilyticum lentocellum (strain ATCC 49066 / DSM 5427 / NCIMB 11756 / RHM5) TaxID=642492 RepID=F2JM45_CELLD|nr:hypothetical protein [Cellulosilyticum lentocellum]ADZ85825.1 hypothetical protein Clole_4153 [Cellulosilyticum lentocellum DSM 5427]